MEKTRIAVVGAGAMGSNHARTINNLPDTELSFIIDSDITKAERLASNYGCEFSNSIENLSKDKTDGVVVASPSNLHYELSDELLRNGLDVLVEKPISLEVDDAEALVATASELGRVLMVGHIELFNPVVRELRKIVGNTAIRSMRFNRLGFVADNSRLYHDAVMDLMVHDIAIALTLTQSSDDNIEVLNSVGRQDTSFAPDPVEAILSIHTQNDQTIDAHFRASRAYTGGKVREIKIETEGSVIEADLLTRFITQKVAGEGRFNVGDGVFIQDVKTAFCMPRDNEEPLKLEMQHFASCIEGKSKPEDESVSGRDGLAVLSIARIILQKNILI